MMVMHVQGLLATLIIVSMVVWVKGNHLRPKAIPPNDVIDVIQYGAIGNGVADDSQAFMEAWGAACGGTSNHPVMYIPAGKTFLLGPLNFQGPCKSPTVTVLVMGDIVAPTDIKAWTGHNLRTWIVFGNVNGLTVEGNGKIDGQGGVWWPQANKLVERPSALAFENCNDLKVVGLTHVNSPGSHIHVSGCNGVTMSNLNITAPASSPNTDGIDIGQSINVHILHSNIATGDDCVAISGGSSFINISGVQCGPGHGISIGSLGDNGRTDTVEQVHVRDCTFQGTTNGVRIKTWQGGSGYARNIYFEGIKLEAVANPIIIDQYYCIRQPICKNQTSAVKVSDVYYNGVHGTSTTDVAIKLSCSQSIGCTNIQLYDIYIVSAIPPTKTASFCFNAHGTSSPPTLPSVNHCLLN